VDIPFLPAHTILSNWPLTLCRPFNNSTDTSFNSKYFKCLNLEMSMVTLMSDEQCITFKPIVFCTKSCRNFTSRNISILELLHTWNEEFKSSDSDTISENASLRLCSSFVDKESLLEALKILSPFWRRSLTSSIISGILTMSCEWLIIDTYLLTLLLINSFYTVLSNRSIRTFPKKTLHHLCLTKMAI